MFLRSGSSVQRSWIVEVLCCDEERLLLVVKGFLTLFARPCMRLCARNKRERERDWGRTWWCASFLEFIIRKRLRAASGSCWSFWEPRRRRIVRRRHIHLSRYAVCFLSFLKRGCPLAGSATPTGLVHSPLILK